jgi:hypothetical protein
LAGQARVYTVNKVWRRGEFFWIGLMNDDNGEGPWEEVPGGLPLDRRQAMTQCDEHAKEMAAHE